jgi:putative sigma-54 modulation protein
MTFNVSAKQMTLTDDLRLYAEKKASKIDRLFRNESDAFVVLSRERGRFTAEVTLKNNGMIYRVKETTSDPFASIDSACASIERQIRKNKTRLEKKLKSGPIDWNEYAPSGAEPEDEPEEDLTIVRTKTFEIKPMTPQEAVLQMNLLDHEFYAFRNSEAGGAFAVVYRRTSGGYGLIEDADK